MDKKFIEKVATNAMTYEKIHDAKKDIDIEKLKKLIEDKICLKKYM